MTTTPVATRGRPSAPGRPCWWPPNRPAGSPRSTPRRSWTGPGLNRRLALGAAETQSNAPWRPDPDRKRSTPACTSASERSPCSNSTASASRSSSPSCSSATAGPRAGSAGESAPARRPAPGPRRGSPRPRTTRLTSPIRSRLGGSDGPAGEDQVHGPAGADQARQPDRPAVDQRHAPAAAEHAEDRVLLGHAQIAPQRQLQPAGDRVTRRSRRSPAWTAASGSAPSGRRRPARPGCPARCRPPLGRRRRRTRRPRPCSTATAASSSASNARKASASAAAVGPSTAFRRSGRESSTVVTGPSRSHRGPAVAQPPPAGPHRARRTKVRSASTISSASGSPGGPAATAARPAPRRSPRPAPPRSA